MQNNVSKQHVLLHNNLLSPVEPTHPLDYLFSKYDKQAEERRQADPTMVDTAVETITEQVFEQNKHNVEILVAEQIRPQIEVVYVFADDEEVTARRKKAILRAMAQQLQGSIKRFNPGHTLLQAHITKGVSAEYFEFKSIVDGLTVFHYNNRKMISIAREDTMIVSREEFFKLLGSEMTGCLENAWFKNDGTYTSYVRFPLLITYKCSEAGRKAYDTIHLHFLTTTYKNSDGHHVQVYRPRRPY